MRRVTVSLTVAVLVPPGLIQPDDSIDEYRLRELALAELNLGTDYGAIEYELEEED